MTCNYDIIYNITIFISDFSDIILVDGQMFNYGKPNEDLFFNLTLIPLGSTETESILD